jgi:hypothetical protein
VTLFGTSCELAGEDSIPSMAASKSLRKLARGRKLRRCPIAIAGIVGASSALMNIC